MSYPFSFVKMNGLGNDFAVIDARHRSFEPSTPEIIAWANRTSGIGFDQLISMEAGADDHVFMRVWNSDGSSVETCGNALRCVAFLLEKSHPGKTHLIDTLAGLTKAAVLKSTDMNATVSVDMGKPRLLWHEIPLAEEMDTLRLELQIGPIDAPLYHTPVGVNMGNPHCVFFVEEMDKVDVARSGSLIEHHPLFPQATNVEFVSVISKNHLRMRVWERGAGVTKACGTGACASLVAAARRGLTDRSATVEMDGGSLHIHWAENDHVFMTGPVDIEFLGKLS